MRTDYAFMCDLYDAKDACLRRFAQQRTIGRMQLWGAVDELLACALRADRQDTRRRVAQAVR